MYHAYWDIPSLCLYLLQAFVGMLCLRAAQRDQRKLGPKKVLFQNYTLVIVLFWTILATCRLVRTNIGGTDSVSYIEYFKLCLSPVRTSMMEHVDADLGFQYLNKVLRFITSDYHLLFAVVFSFIAYSIVVFVKRYSHQLFSCIPLFLAFYVYLRGYNTMRSVLAMSLIIAGLTCVADRSFLMAYVLMICTALTHKVGIIYALVIPYLHFVYYHRVKAKYFIWAAIAIIGLGPIARSWFIRYAFSNDLGGAYGSYAEKAMETEGIFGAFVECFLQYMLALLLIFFSSKIRRVMAAYGKEMYNTIDLLLYICYFDMLLIPINIMMGIWRGNEFFYIPRLCMWGVIIFVFTRNFTASSKKIVKGVAFLLFVAWFIFRLNRTYEASSLMPYIFAPFS